MIGRLSVRLVVLAALSSSGCASSSGAPNEWDPEENVIPAVEVVQAREGALPLSERLTGTVRAAGEVAIFPEISGPVVEVYVENGDAVRRGDPLVRIRVTGSESQMAQAQSALAAARAEVSQAEAILNEVQTRFERFRILADRGLVSAS
jgi:multidrug efflux pump subunit AcrA (membrane-fusion protein)